MREKLVSEAERLSLEPIAKASSGQGKKSKFSFSSDSDPEETIPLSVRSRKKKKKSKSVALSPIRQEVFKYLSDPRRDLEILHEYPSVKNVFLRYNTPLPSRHAY